MLWRKKSLFKEFDNEQKLFVTRKFPTPPPITFLMVRPLHHVETATVFVVCFVWMSEINIRCFAANQRSPACEIRYTYSSFLVLNSCGMGGLFGLCQKSATRRNIFENKNACRRISAVIRDLQHQKRGMPPTAVIVRREVLGKTWVTCPTIDVKLNYAARMTWPVKM